MSFICQDNEDIQKEMWQWKGKAATAEGYQRCKWRQEQGGSLLLPSVGQVCAWHEGLLALEPPGRSVSCGGLAWAGANMRWKHFWLRQRAFFSRPGLSDTDSFTAMEKREENLPCPAPWGAGGAWYPLPGQPPSSFSCFWPYLVLLVLALLGQQSSLNLQKSIPQREGHCCLFCELIELTDWSIWLKHLPSALQPGHRGTSADWVLWRGGQGATGMTGQVCSFQEKQTKKTNITLKPLREQRAEAI